MTPKMMAITVKIVHTRRLRPSKVPRAVTVPSGGGVHVTLHIHVGGVTVGN